MDHWFSRELVASTQRENDTELQPAKAGGGGEVGEWEGDNFHSPRATIFPIILKGGGGNASIAVPGSEHFFPVGSYIQKRSATLSTPGKFISHFEYLQENTPYDRLIKGNEASRKTEKYRSSGAILGL